MNDIPDEMWWLAGLLEGEGTFLAGPPSSPNRTSIVVQMTDRDVVERVSAVMGTATVRTVHPRRYPHHKISFVTSLRGARARDLMVELRPLMGLRRQGQIDRALASFDPTRCHRKRSLSDDAVRDLRRRAGQGESVERMARELGLARSAAYHIVKRVTYADVA